MKPIKIVCVMSNNSFFGLLTGLAAGAVLGLLLAPEKGEETRRKVREAALDGYDDLKDSLSDLGDKVGERTSGVRESLSSLKDSILEQGGDFKENARAKILEKLDQLEKLITKSEGPVDEQPEPEE